MLMPSVTLSDQSVALDNDIFEGRGSDRKSLASNTNATDEVKYLQQMTERWHARARGSSKLPRRSFDSSRNPLPVRSPSWILVFVNDVNIFQLVK